MIILDPPYVSRLLEETIIRLGIPVLNGQDVLLERETDMNILSEDAFFAELKQKQFPPLYTISEDSIPVINKHLGQSALSSKINSLKNKYEFRKRIRDRYPDLNFRQIELHDIHNLHKSDLRYPFILKPIMGICSIGVHKIDNEEQLKKSIEEIMILSKGASVNSAVNLLAFILEDYIDGSEYAVDAYYDSSGESVVVNIMMHPFSGDGDTSDRLYYTSKNIVRELYTKIQSELAYIGDVFGLRCFPVHIEFRLNAENKLVPIECNPLRFTGWCGAELSNYAYGINPHEYFLSQKKPDWKSILENKDDALYCIGCGVIPKHISPGDIKSIDYDAFASLYGKILKFVKTDYVKYAEFAYLFSKLKDASQIDTILKKDFSEFIVT